MTTTCCAVGNTVALSALLGWLTIASLAPAENWDRFRGPNGSGVGRAMDLRASWTVDDELWRVDLPGVGHSSPVVWNQTLFVASGDEGTGRRWLESRRGADGKLRWRRELTTASHRKHKLNSFASATPAVDADHVYWCWATPERLVVVAVDHSGRERWRQDLGPQRGGHGDGMSPIVVGKLVIMANEHEGPSALVALDRMSGEVKWKKVRESRAHWATPCVRPGPQGAELIFANWSQGITAVDPVSGRGRWAADVFDKQHYQAAIGSPVVAGDLVLGVCGYLGRGNEVVAVRAGSKDAGEKIWRVKRGAPLCTTPLVVGQLVFLWADNGIVTCVELSTGKVHWQKRIGGQYYSSPVSNGRIIYNVSTSGRVTALAAKDEYQLLGKTELGEGSHSTIAIANDTLYLRTFTKLIAAR